MNTKPISLITCIAAMSISCQKELTEKNIDNPRVRFSIETSDQTRSSLNPDTNTLKDINIIAYRDGYLESGIFTDDLDNIEMVLVPGEYDFYAIGNLGEELIAPAIEAEIKAWRYSIASTSTIAMKNSVFTASCHASVNSRTGPISLVMTRLMAKCGFKFNPGEIPGMKVTAVRLCQAALDVAPFIDGGSTPLKVEETGDYASEKDIAAINSGGTAYFYTLENAQGKLIENNTDQWNKVPDNIPAKADQCTYIEVTTRFEDSPEGYSGSVLYRFYLGYDTVGDFTVSRNKEYTISIIPSKDGFDRISWIIDTSDLSFDALFGFEPSDYPEYVGQWGLMNIPSASEKNNATIRYKGNSMAVGRSGDGKIQSITLDNGIMLYYVPEVSTTTVFLYASTKTAASGGKQESFSIISSEQNITIDVDTPEWPSFMIRNTASGQALDKTELNEDGYEIAEFDLMLGNQHGTTVRLSSFAIPDEKLAAALGYSSGNGKADIMGRFTEDLIDCARIGRITSSSSGESLDEDDIAGGLLDIPEDHNSMIDTDIAAHGVLYGRKPGNTVLSICRESLSGKELAIRTDISCSVAMAFPGQRFLGEQTNTQLEINSLNRNDHTQSIDLDLYDGEKGSKAATWKCIRIAPETGTGNLDGTDLERYARKGHDNMELIQTAPDHFRLDLLPPKADNGNTPVNPFFACGAFCINGSVTNPYTKRTICGYYPVDIVLKFSVTAQIDFLPGYVGFYFVPYNICYAHWDYSYSWRNNMPLVIIPETLANANATEGANDTHQSFITGDKPIGLVPIPHKTNNCGQKEYRIYLHKNNYEEYNDFPFYPANESTAMTLLWENISSGEHGEEAGIDVSRAFKFSFGIPDKNGNITRRSDKEIRITRENYTDYPAFEGFYHITKAYEGKYGGSFLNKIGYYVIEASEKAQALKSPFYSYDL